MDRKAPLIILVAALPLLAGCMGSDPKAPDGGDLPNLLRGPLSLNGTMTFLKSVVPAVHFGHGLYEPTIDVSDSGVIYISSHSTGVDLMGAPVFFSKDDGKTWAQLPFAASATVPAPGHGATPPPSDEIFVVAGDDGQAWGVDITLATYPVNGWCNDGATHCYHNPNAYNREDTDCAPASFNDRPWAAYANGTLLMVNNPGGGPVQVGAMKVPPPAYVQTPADAPTWNMCAGSGGFIPGIPDMRDDLFFAVPQQQGGKYVVITGNAKDVMTVKEKKVFSNSNVGASEIGEYGQVVFDANGTMFMAVMSNSDASGGIQLALSEDDGDHFLNWTYRFEHPVSSVYIDGNKHGPGALINWGLVTDEGTDWYLGHLINGTGGRPEIRNATLAVDNGPAASRHVQGAALGRDGRGYMVMSEVSGNDDAEMVGHAGTTPLSVVTQKDGPTLPVAPKKAA